VPADSDWAADLRERRREKDAFLADHPQSPVPPGAREGFDGLDYYPPDPDYRVEATVTVHDDPEPVELEASAGPPVRYLRVVSLSMDLPSAGGEGEGESESESEDAAVTLAGLRQEGDGADEPVFVPFADATTGETTYAGGRYLELHPERPLEDGETVPVDFNLAYTPFCAFSETFACPLPPESNRLSVAVEAGERVTADAFDAGAAVDDATGTDE
jgi:hypothetical protein